MTAGSGPDAAPDTLATATRLLSIVNGSWMTQAVRTAAELGVPDLLADGPRSSDDLAVAIGAHPPFLRRLLQALTAIEICSERDDGAFELTAMGQLLRTDVDGTVRSWALYWGGGDLWAVWARLPEAIRIGKSGRELHSGVQEFEHLERHPDLAALFQQAMVELTRLVTPGIVAAYDFSRHRRVVDVGGGYGELLAAILVAHPELTAVLFDLPHVVQAAPAYLQGAGVAERCELARGSFFESVPAGADLYILKSVIHDWDDDKSRGILATCRSAMPPGATLLVIERIRARRLEASPAHQAVARADLVMLLSLAAQERTEDEFRALLSSANLDVTSVMPAGAGFNIIEAVASAP